MIDALLFDLDDTLLVEEAAAAAAFLATASCVTAVDVDAARLASDARARARELWYASPAHPYCRAVGISSWEGLWCRFEDLDELRAWAPAYRAGAWSAALRDQGIDDPGLAAELGERFGVERRARFSTFPDAVATLPELRSSYALAVVTNGAACLQREKLAASGLSSLFDAVVVSADLGVAKPEARVFHAALSALGVPASRAAMIGDSLRRDVEGARAAGLALAVHLDRAGGGDIASLAELPALVGSRT